MLNGTARRSGMAILEFVAQHLTNFVPVHRHRRVVIGSPVRRQIAWPRGRVFRFTRNTSVAWLAFFDERALRQPAQFVPQMIAHMAQRLGVGQEARM